MPFADHLKQAKTQAIFAFDFHRHVSEDEEAAICGLKFNIFRPEKCIFKKTRGPTCVVNVLEPVKRRDQRSSEDLLLRIRKLRVPNRTPWVLI